MWHGCNVRAFVVKSTARRRSTAANYTTQAYLRALKSTLWLPWSRIGVDPVRKRTRSDNRMHWFKVPVGRDRGRVDVEFTVRADNVSKRWFCFYAQMADLE